MSLGGRYLNVMLVYVHVSGVRPILVAVVLGPALPHQAPPLPPPPVPLPPQSLLSVMITHREKH